MPPISIENLESEVCSCYQEGLIAQDISYLLKVPLYQVYQILRKHNIPRRSRSQRNDFVLYRKGPSFENLRRIPPEQRPLLLAALMLYCAEGAKTGTTVDFTNSSPAVLKVFLKFLQEVCQIDRTRLRLYLYCFEDQNVAELIEFWSETLKVHKWKFTKPYIRQRTLSHRRTMPHGVLHIRYSDKLLLQEILSLIEINLKQLTE